jgi:hypothetical protein
MLIRSLVRIHGAAMRGWHMLHGQFAAGVAELDRFDRIRLDEPGRQPELGPRVALFCHFDRFGQIHPHTRRYIEELIAAGFCIVLVSNSGRLAAPDAAWAAERVARILVRRNVGYDFAAWRDALARTGLPSQETRCLVFVNDSVYGPFTPLRSLMARLDFDQADVWGLTDNWQHRYHLQSYFVAFGPKAVASAAFRDFWAGVRDVRSKWQVVKAYEIGLTQRLLRGGLRCRAVWGYTDLLEAARRSLSETVEGQGHDAFGTISRTNARRVVKAAVRRAALNPTCDLWRLLIEAGFPFIKRELLRDNPTRIPDVATWPLALADLPQAERELILTDLQRCLRGFSP